MSKKHIISVLIFLSFLQLSAQDSWIIDKYGCKVHNPHPKNWESITWTGDCIDSIAEGEGELIWHRFGFKTKSRYNGLMVNGKPEGQGTYQLSSGWIQKGEFKNGELIEGMELFRLKGTFDTCIGTFQNEILVEGVRIEKYRKDIYVYKGKFVDEKLEGHGELEVRGLYSYVGDFKNGVEDGEGILTRTIGERYEGKFKNGYYVNGRLTLENRLIFECDFEEFYPFYGTIIYSDKTTYTGDIKNYLPHGNGTIYLTNGDILTCGWKNNTAHGPGEYKFSDGIIYKGHWINGNIDGKGEILYPDGKTNIGIWDKGVLIEELNGH